MRRRRRKGLMSGLNLAVALVIVGFMLLPLYWAVVTSLKTLHQSYATPTALFPPTPTFAAYSQVVHTQGGSLLTSFIIAVGATLISLLISVPAAYALANFRFRVTWLVTLALLVAQTVPGIVLGTSFFKIFAGLHLLNSYLGLIIADSTYCVPFSILVVRGFMIGMPRELLEAARVDGATLLGTLLRIVIPLSRPAILTAALFSFLFAWGDFLFRADAQHVQHRRTDDAQHLLVHGSVHLAVAGPHGRGRLRSHPVGHPAHPGPTGNKGRDRHRRAQRVITGPVDLSPGSRSSIQVSSPSSSCSSGLGLASRSFTLMSPSREVGIWSFTVKRTD